MRISGDSVFAEDLAWCRRRDKRGLKIAMQQLSPAAPVEDLFAEASAFRQAFPCAWRGCRAKGPEILQSQDLGPE
jgi:hypothetical protein